MYEYLYLYGILGFARGSALQIPVKLCIARFLFPLSFPTFINLPLPTFMYVSCSNLPLDFNLTYRLLGGISCLSQISLEKWIF